METQVIEEGETKLEVPKLEDYRTSPNEYVPSQTPVFFNPVMEFSRDISISSLQVMRKNINKLRICDLLAGVGARGLRYAKELENISEVLINDWSPEAVNLIQKNVKHNELSVTKVTNEEANSLLHNYRPRFHVIDIDPFGTPIPFLDSSFSAISRKGILLITATDTAPLCGAYPKPCLRKYGAKPLRTPYSREIGLRILIGSIQRRAAAHDLALVPVLSHATQHYFRIHYQVHQGAKKADSVLKKQGYLTHCFDCGKRITTNGIVTELPKKCECGRNLQHAGPLWLGKIADKNHLQNTIQELSNRQYKQVEKEKSLLKSLMVEIEGPPWFCDFHEVCSRAGVSPPKFDRVLKNLEERDYFASRTHFSDTGLRTGASIEVLTDLVSK